MNAPPCWPLGRDRERTFCLHIGLGQLSKSDVIAVLPFADGLINSIPIGVFNRLVSREISQQYKLANVRVVAELEKRRAQARPKLQNRDDPLFSLCELGD